MKRAVARFLIHAEFANFVSIMSKSHTKTNKQKSTKTSGMLNTRHEPEKDVLQRNYSLFISTDCLRILRKYTKKLWVKWFIQFQLFCLAKINILKGFSSLNSSKQFFFFQYSKWNWKIIHKAQTPPSCSFSKLSPPNRDSCAGAGTAEEQLGVCLCCQQLPHPAQAPDSAGPAPKAKSA